MPSSMRAKKLREQLERSVEAGRLKPQSLQVGKANSYQGDPGQPPSPLLSWVLVGRAYNKFLLVSRGAVPGLKQVAVIHDAITDQRSEPITLDEARGLYDFKVATDQEYLQALSEFGHAGHGLIPESPSQLVPLK